MTCFAPADANDEVFELVKDVLVALGMPYKQEKVDKTAECGTVLGMDFRLANSCGGNLTPTKPTMGISPERSTKLVEEIQAVVKTGKLSPKD